MTKAKKKDGLWDYTPPAELDGVERAVSFLLWAAKNFPRRPVSMPHITRVALSEKKLPLEESKEVELWRTKIGTLRKRMEDNHNRGIVHHPGIGYRATVDEDDKLENVFEPKRRRVQSSIAGFSRTQAMIDKSKLKDPLNKDRYESLAEAGKRLTSPAISRRLAPPENDDDAEENDK